MKLWLARHARPLIDPGVCYGATDLDADDEATQIAARQLALEVPLGLTMVSSPLRRCYLLGQKLHALRPDLHFVTDERLAEMNFGCWERVRWSDIPRSELDAWTADFNAYRFGGSESVGEFLQRVSAARDDVLTVGSDTLWITHAGVIRAASVLAQGVRQVRQADQWPIDAPAFGLWCVHHL